MPSQLIPMSSVTNIMHSPLFLIGGTVVLLFALYRLFFQALGQLAMLGTFAALGAAVYAVIKLHNAISAWQQKTAHASTQTPVHLPPANHVTNSSDIVNPLASGSHPSALQLPNLNATSPLAHENSWVVAAFLVFAALWLLAYLVYRSMSPITRAKLLQRLRSSSSGYAVRQTNRNDPTKFPLVGIEIGVRKDNGKPITIDGKDRFINTLVLGSIGTGKTSRILTKGVYQDIRAIADGVPMDVIVVDPDGGFAQSAVNMAERFGVHTDIMDLRGTMKSTVSFNPFGGEIADIIDNVRAALQEKMGRQDGFFQNAQDDLVRTVIQVQVPLWPEADFLQFADLVTDPLHFRAICSMVNDCAGQQGTAPKKKRKADEMDEITGMWEHERPDIEARFHALSPHNRSMVLSAARSFLMDTRSAQQMEKLETITKGLKIVVNELATNPRLREVFSRDSLPPFDFKAFLEAGREQKGRLMVVVTGNRPAGKLFGKLFLVTLKMYSLERGGTEDTRRPVYLYVDEFAVYGTESFTEMFSQARKYRVGMTLAIQARAQLLDVSKKFMDVVEGSCRNKVYFPAPSPDDARFLEHSLGSVKNIRETVSENKLSWFWFDNRMLDRRVSTQETIDPRYRLEDIAYGLSKDEAIFAMTVDNQVQVPCVGITSFADEWVHERRGFFEVGQGTGQPGLSDMLKSAQKWFGRGHGAAREVQAAGAVSTEVSQNNSGTTTSVITPAKHVLPTADPNAVIPIARLRTAEMAETAVTQETTETVTYQQEAVAQEETKVELTSEPENVAAHPAENQQQTADEPRNPSPCESPAQEGASDTPKVIRIDLRQRRQPKRCPQCEDADLELTPDLRKWRCPQCGFERKNR